MINQRLFDQYKINTKKDLKIKNLCPRPFDTLLIDKQGSCYACECTSWLPQSIGNLQIKSLSEIIGSDMHQHLQSSITDGTYRYCNEHQCPYVISNTVEHMTGGTAIKHLRLAIDNSCNLRCPSCRKDMIFHKEGSAYNLGIRLADRINEWLYTHTHPIQVHIGSDGDPFASHVYRHFMAHTPERINIKYSILTNGLLFEDFHANVPHVINNLQELGISIDGASRETYEKLRLGGSWQKINQNLKCISDLRRRYEFKFILHFVVQKDNYHEMEKIVDLGQQYGCDRVWLNKIEDWDTMDNFKHHNIFNPAHNEHAQYQTLLDNLKQRAKGNNLIEAPTLFKY